MKLTPRLTFVFIAYALLLLTVAGLLAYNSGRDALRAATISELQSIALEKEAALDDWMEEKITGLHALAADPTTIRMAQLLLDATPGSPTAQNAHDALVANLKSHQVQGKFLELSFLDLQTGQVLASTNPVEEGRFKDDRPYFLNGRTGSFVQYLYYSPVLQSTAMTASTPLQTPDGETVGVLTARIDLEELNAIINRRTGLHDTDEAYLVDSSRLFVTQPRSTADSVLVQTEVRTEAVERCLDQQSGVVEAPDYRNIPAFVVYRWLPARELCLILKMNETEAYRPAREFGLTIAGITGIALLAAAGVAAALARSLTRPILAIQKGAARFGRGELDIRLDEVSHDELGQLAYEFNRMAEGLAEHQTHLRRRAEQFFTITPDLLCTIDPAGRMLDLNPAWEQTLGIPRGQFKDQLLTAFVHPDDLSVTKSALERVAGEGSVRFENRFRHRDGHYCWLAWVLVASIQDRLLYAAARDITDRRLAEERLRQQAEDLERSNRELEEFAYVASHDLQEPLQQVADHVQLLERRYKGRLDEDGDEFIDYAMDGANRLKSLISDLLAYWQAGTGDREPAPVDMEEVFVQVTTNLKPAIQSSRSIVTHDPLPQVLGNREELVQLLQNLIDNSIKFRGKETPRIHVGSRQLSERWLLFVRDNGIGIDPRFTERVFVIFQRLHSRDDYPGTGIGLAICRKIVERHGGHIWVDSEPGKGATFYFTLAPAGSDPTGKAPAELKLRKTRDTIADRATDLI